MSFNAEVKFPHEFNKKEVAFNSRQGKLHFVDAIATLYPHFNNPEYPMKYLYITVDNVLWEPNVFVTENNNITEIKNSDEYRAPQFMVPFNTKPNIIRDLYLDPTQLNNLEVGFCTFVNLLESDTIKYRIVVPPTVAVHIMAGRGGDKFVWEYNLDLNPGEIDHSRITECATYLFVNCVVYDSVWNVVPINIDTINVNNVKECTACIADLLTIGKLNSEIFCDAPLQHPLVEYFIFSWWGCLAVDRLHRILKEMHSSSIILNDFFLIYSQLCTRAEVSSARPPSWPYRNPLNVKESYFIGNHYAADKPKSILNFWNTYPVVDNVTYLNSGCNPYNLCCNQDELKRRLLEWFPMADNLCYSGVMVAGTLPATVHVEELYRLRKTFNWVDLFIYGKTATQRYKSLEELLKRLDMYSRDYKIKYNVCNNTITASMWKIDKGAEGLVYKKGPCSLESKETKRHCDFEIKIIYTNAKTRSEILYNFDSTYIQVGYDSCTFCSTPEFHYFTPRRESLIVRSSILLHRLLKISEKGFLPVLDQDHCTILGTRRDLPKLVCNRYTLFNFARGTFITGLNHSTEQVKIIQKIMDTNTMGNTVFVENIHFVERPTNIGPEVHLFHVLRKVSYEDVLLNSYNSYHGSKTNKLKIKRSIVFQRMHDNTVPLIRMKSRGNLLVRNFEFIKTKKEKDKEEKRKIASLLTNRSLETIRLYQESLEQGKLIQEGSEEEGYYYRNPNNEEEMNRATYVVRINDVDTYPTKEEIESIIERKSHNLDIKIGMIQFDIRVRIGEKCRAGVKLDGTKIVSLPGKRIRFTNIDELENRIMEYLSKKDELSSFLKYGASVDIPVKGFYIKTTLEDKYIDTDEKTISGQTDLDMNYDHTAVLRYDELMCFNLVRVTRNLNKNSPAEEILEEKEDPNDSDLCSSDDSEEEEDCQEKNVLLPTEVKRVVNKVNCLDPVKCISLNDNTSVTITKKVKEDNRTVLVDKNIPIKSIDANLFPNSEKDNNSPTVSEEIIPTKFKLASIEKDNSVNEEDEEEELSAEDIMV